VSSIGPWMSRIRARIHIRLKVVCGEFSVSNRVDVKTIDGGRRSKGRSGHTIRVDVAGLHIPIPFIHNFARDVIDVIDLK
jgi:hypothetical protein